MANHLGTLGTDGIGLTENGFEFVPRDCLTEKLLFLVLGKTFRASGYLVLGIFYD